MERGFWIWFASHEKSSVDLHTGLYYITSYYRVLNFIIQGLNIPKRHIIHHQWQKCMLVIWGWPVAMFCEHISDTTIAEASLLLFSFVVSKADKNSEPKWAIIVPFFWNYNELESNKIIFVSGTVCCSLVVFKKITIQTFRTLMCKLSKFLFFFGTVCRFTSLPNSMSFWFSSLYCWNWFSTMETMIIHLYFQKLIILPFKKEL